MMHILLCDDEPEALNALSEIIQAYHQGTCEITAFSDANEALDFLSINPLIDLIFLDIIMPLMTGVELAERMRQNGYEGEVVFLTSSNDYAAESYQVRAMDYVLKPPERAVLFALLDRFQERYASRQRSIDIIRKSVVRRILFRNLLYVEVIGHHLHFHLHDGEVFRIYAQLSEYLDQLLASGVMAQCNRSFIANLDFIELCESGKIVMTDGTTIVVTRNFKSFQHDYLQYAFGRRIHT